MRQFPTDSHQNLTLLAIRKLGSSCHPRLIAWSPCFYWGKEIYSLWGEILQELFHIYSNPLVAPRKRRSESSLWWAWENNQSILSLASLSKYSHLESICLQDKYILVFYIIPLVVRKCIFNLFQNPKWNKQIFKNLFPEIPTLVYGIPL